MELTGKLTTGGLGRLISPIMAAKDGSCVSFYYFNVGLNGSSLHVYAAVNNTKTNKLDLTRRLYSGEVDPTINQWKLARVPLPSTISQYQVLSLKLLFSCRIKCMLVLL